MTPDKLYIPTTTLNFNNIMSSESISPAGFYSERGFGYGRFTKVEPNNLDRRIILYDKYPDFQIFDNEIENYPLIIELDTKYLAEDVTDIIQEDKSGVFYSEKTIYFNPFSTKLFFANEREKISTLSKAEPSIETKMVSLYQNCFCAKPANIDMFDLRICDLQDSKADFSKHISKDRKINKLKGFLYAYLLGANKSLSSEIVNLKKCAKDLRNVLSAVLVSKDNWASHQQQNQIEKLTTSINEAFYKAEGLQAIIESKKEQYKCENFIDIIKGEGLHDMWLQKQNIRPSFQLSQFYVTKRASPDEKQEADSYFENLERAINKYAIPKNIKTEELPILQHCSKINEIPRQKEFLSKLLTEYLQEAYNSNDFLRNRYEFAKSGGKLFREELQDKWDGSEYKTYLNTLLKNLNEYSAFSLNSTDNLTLKSFAAFCQKGEEDIDKLEDYLISNGIGDFCIAFALWGIVFGFANMPKTLTNELFLSDDLDYVSEVYKYIFKQIHGIELEGKIERKQVEKPQPTAVTISSKINEPADNTAKTATSNQSQLEQELSDFEEYKSRDKTTKQEIIKKLSDAGIKSLVEWDKKKADSIKWTNSKGQKKLMSAIDKSKPIGKRKPNKEHGVPTLFEADAGFEPAKDFYKDSNAYSYIENILPNDKKIQKQFREDLVWLQGNYNELYYDKKKGNQEGCYRKKPKDNQSVIEHFSKYLHDKQTNPKANWLRAIYNKIDIDKIIDKLKSLYLQNER
jgi:hypothetical protein